MNDHPSIHPQQPRLQPLTACADAARRLREVCSSVACEIAAHKKTSIGFDDLRHRDGANEFDRGPFDWLLRRSVILSSREAERTTWQAENEEDLGPHEAGRTDS
jgi:hypothetical protein